MLFTVNQNYSVSILFEVFQILYIIVCRFLRFSLSELIVTVFMVALWCDTTRRHDGRTDDR